MPSYNSLLSETIRHIAEFYDARKYGYEGVEGYRKSTDLRKLAVIIEEMGRLEMIHPGRTVFLDLGCADGRVNLLFSHFVKHSIGIEIDPLILGEYKPRKLALSRELEERRLQPFPENVRLFQGSSLEAETYARIAETTGIRFDQFDLFYTYITLHDLFGEKIASEAQKGALYLVYGFHKVLPRYEGLEILVPDIGGQSIAAVYRKV
ncbi:MAG: class I SAM-dependent methyltransferase [Deltaproteobacteria bacterium]|nr:class I SAM-dependent methyltransferase [Deltaproteobacteria bacterium]